MHAGIVDFVERALETTDLRLYQGQVLAKYTGSANYEQPMHTDRNHSFLPPRMEPPWWHVEPVLYLSDVDDGTADSPRSRRDSAGGSVNDIFMPDGAPSLYARERPRGGAARCWRTAPTSSARCR